MLLICGGVAIPLAAAVLAISGTSRPDLSDLVPIGNSAENYVVVNWSTLLHHHAHALVAGSPLSTGVPVQAIGYMFESDRSVGEGALVQDFVLLPDAGNIFHPAHRFGDQMIAVHVSAGRKVCFSSRALVWVRGTFRAIAGDPTDTKPLYGIDEARVEPVERGEIQKYFK